MNTIGGPIVSVVIPVWNRPAQLRRCLSALKRQTMSAEQFEVLVVDNGSTDETPEVAKAFGYTLLVETKPGSYAARNRGIAHARGVYVAFTDSDCIPDEYWLERLVAAAEALPSVAIFGGDVRVTGVNRTRAADAYEELYSYNQWRNIRTGRAITANWLSRKTTLTEAGGFRDDLKSGGDYELSSRLHAEGRELYFIDSAVVDHPARTTVSDLAAKARRVVGGRASIRGLGQGQTRHWVKLLSREQAWRLLKLSDTPYSAKLTARLALLLALLWGVSLMELMRLRFGGEPRRA